MKTYVKKVVNKKGEVKEWIWVVYYDKYGKRQRKSLKLLNTKANMKLAQNKIVPALFYKLENDKFIDKTVPTLDEYAKVSFEINAFNRSINTQNDYEGAYKKHLSPNLGHLKIDKIKPSHIKSLQSKLLETIAPRTIRNVRAVLSGVLKDALADELIEKNPLSLVKTVKVEKTTINPFSMNEIKLILENSTGQDRNFFALGFMSGMRSGEMIGLKWNDIDFSKAEISVSRSRKMGVDGKTKTLSSNRVIDIIDSLIPYLKDQYRLTGSLSGYVFLNRKKEAIYDIKRVRENGWKKTLKKCQVPYRTIYQTRHSFATIMLENGEDILWISNMLGHTDSSMTLSKYAHYVKRKERKRAQFMNNELALNDTVNDTELLAIA